MKFMDEERGVSTSLLAAVAAGVGIATLGLVPAPASAVPPEVANARAQQGGQARVALRVHSPGGDQLASAVVHSAARTLKTSKRAVCFGTGTGGSGRRAAIGLRGPSALGALADAASEVAALRPLRVTDAFATSFGLGLCGVGGFDSDPVASYWAFWVNGDFGEGAAGSTRVRAGDTIVFALRPSSDYPAQSLPAAEPPQGRRLVVGAQGPWPVRGTGASDRLLVRDRARDRVSCGAGDDQVIADRTDRIADDCERVSRR